MTSEYPISLLNGHRKIEESDSEPKAKAPVKPIAPAKKPAKSKWDGEDEEEDVPVVSYQPQPFQTTKSANQAPTHIPLPRATGRSQAKRKKERLSQ